MAKKKYYAVKVGKTPGIYLTWEACKSQVDGFSGALYKSFPTLSEAEAYIGSAEAVSGGETEEASVDGFSGALYKSFPTLAEAEAYIGPVETVSGGETEEATGNGGDDPLAGVSMCEDSCLLPDSQSAVAYVDGSYNVATGEYSCGVVFLSGTEELHFAEKGVDRELASMRNVAGEILGAELAMKKALEFGIRSLCIYHDYQGIASWCLGEWKTNKEGTRAYKEYFDSICDKMQIRFVKVKGHSGDKYNDLADELAKSVIF